jgi:tetratricopeptide (TPR) repeat protein
LLTGKLPDFNLKTMNKDLFYKYIRFPELLDNRSLNDIQEILEEYPYFQSAHLILLKNLDNQGNISFEKELKKSAVWIPDRKKLFFLLDKRVLLSVNDVKPVDIEDTIDFNVLADTTDFTDTDKKDDELEKLINAASVHAITHFNVDDKVDLDDFKKRFGKKANQRLKDNEEISDEKQRRKKLIENFIVEQPKIIPKDENSEIKEYKPKDADNMPEMITDTLAKIYMKQGKYDKAILAYEKLSLKYPKKNSYFAGQIKKIKQLINNNNKA